MASTEEYYASYALLLIVGLLFTMINIVLVSREKGKISRVVLALNAANAFVHAIAGIFGLNFAFDFDPTNKVYNGGMFFFLLLEFVVYLVSATHILFCWFGIISRQALSWSNKKANWARGTCCTAATIWLVTAVTTGFVYSSVTKSSVVSGRVVIGAICVIPVVVSVLFVLLTYRMSHLIKGLGQDVKAQKFAKKLTIISACFIVTMYMHIAYLIVCIGPVGWIESFQPHYVWPLFYLPRVLFMAAVTWFFHPKWDPATPPKTSANQSGSGSAGGSGGTPRSRNKIASGNMPMTAETLDSSGDDVTATRRYTLEEGVVVVVAASPPPPQQHQQQQQGEPPQSTLSLVTPAPQQEENEDIHHV
eukprot:TRINITY_DN3101_c0_g1_i3.p1 TRINITY_DN3101_c0_g1~~TRINITY_DN3101_c0_g1_i3.p1  ORF type:complete len:362 (-),score=73.19 TRINITY_DN3101_c0_g1_i3:26-1111(-)